MEGMLGSCVKATKKQPLISGCFFYYNSLGLAGHQPESITMNIYNFNGAVFF